jgi:hypothetical protein
MRNGRIVGLPGFCLINTLTGIVKFHFATCPVTRLIRAWVIPVWLIAMWEAISKTSSGKGVYFWLRR